MPKVAKVILGIFYDHTTLQLEYNSTTSLTLNLSYRYILFIIKYILKHIQAKTGSTKIKRSSFLNSFYIHRFFFIII